MIRPQSGRIIKNIYHSKELDRQATASNFEVVRHFGSGPPKRCDPISLMGYAINESRLRDDPAAANKLAAKLREIRSNEKNVYASVREFFAEASADYNKDSKECRSFYALLQDRFHFAVTNKTFSEIIMTRADHKDPNMGLRNSAGNIPRWMKYKLAKTILIMTSYSHYIF
jgi:hypothetical protein